MYEHAAWDCVTRGIGNSAYQPQDLDHTEVYTVPLPHSLKDRTLLPLKVSQSSSSAITPGLDAVTPRASSGPPAHSLRPFWLQG